MEDIQIGTILCGNDAFVGRHAPYKFFKVVGKTKAGKLVCHQMKATALRNRIADEASVSDPSKYHSVIPKIPETLIHKPIHMVPSEFDSFVIRGENKSNYRVWDGTRLMCFAGNKTNRK